MFSRGNVKEKARLLGLQNDQPATGDGSQTAFAVDLYAGIGYFTFSYASLGMKVLCWEINPWSVEGLRRGAKANGWTVKVVKGEDLQLPATTLMAGNERILVFQQDNGTACQRLAEIRSSKMADVNILHVNCGFLPTSQPVWRDSWDMTQTSTESLLHLHENVGVHDISKRRLEIQAVFEEFARSPSGRRVAQVEHVELVKTYAPDVWHCVFDVRITRC